MRRCIIATHGRMAGGIRTTLELIIGPQEKLTCINAYTEECPDPMPEFKRIVEEYPEDEIVIMTDLFGGSVNNNAMALVKNERVHVVTGINLAVAISIITADGDDTKAVIEEAVEEARSMILYCNPMAEEAVEDDDF